MANFTKFKDSQSWHIGWYPTHEDDWGLSLQYISNMAINLDVTLNSRRDWRIQVQLSHFDSWRKKNPIRVEFKSYNDN